MTSVDLSENMTEVTTEIVTPAAARSARRLATARAKFYSVSEGSRCYENAAGRPELYIPLTPLTPVLSAGPVPPGSEGA